MMLTSRLLFICGLILLCGCTEVGTAHRAGERTIADLAAYRQSLTDYVMQVDSCLDLSDIGFAQQNLFYYGPRSHQELSHIGAEGLLFAKFFSALHLKSTLLTYLDSDGFSPLCGDLCIESVLIPAFEDVVNGSSRQDFQRCDEVIRAMGRYHLALLYNRLGNQGLADYNFNLSKAVDLNDFFFSYEGDPVAFQSGQ